MPNIKHKCEGTNYNGVWVCELCKLNGDSKTELKKRCGGWRALEKAIEIKFANYVEDDGNYAPRFEVATGDPDRIVLLKHSFFLIEFKRKGEQPTLIQLNRHKILRSKGYAVYCTSSLKEAKAIYDKEKNKIS